MRGWVYIITNKAMPGLVKVGYTMKDPQLRAAELHHTGAPYPYNVDYDVLVENPREVEQQVHCHLKNKNEGKEWFRCTTEEAIAAIKAVTGKKIILENFKNVDSAEATLFQLHKTALERDIPRFKKHRIIENTKSVDSVKSSIAQQPKTLLNQDIPIPKLSSIAPDGRTAYNTRLSNLMAEFKLHNKFSLEDWKNYARKNITRLEPIPEDSRSWLD